MFAYLGDGKLVVGPVGFRVAGGMLNEPLVVVLLLLRHGCSSFGTADLWRAARALLDPMGVRADSGSTGKNNFHC